MRIWDVMLLMLLALLLLEYWALLHWGFFRFGILVWRHRWAAFPVRTLGTSVMLSDDVYWMASESLWLFQRKSLSGGILQYKGAIRRSEDGAIVTVMAPFSSVALLVAAPAVLTARGDAPAGAWLMVAAAIGLLLFAWARGRAAASRFESAGTCLTSASS